MTIDGLLTHEPPNFSLGEGLCFRRPLEKRRPLEAPMSLGPGVPSYGAQEVDLVGF